MGARDTGRWVDGQWVHETTGRDVDEDVISKEKLQNTTGLAAAAEAARKPTPTPRPTPTPSGDAEPKRADFPAGLGGIGAYNQAMAAWRRKNGGGAGAPSTAADQANVLKGR
jgi:hypothetical protein